MKSRLRKKAVFAGVIILLLATVALLFFLNSTWVGIWRDLKRFSETNYEGAFFSMYDISCYNEEDFLTYRGILTVKAEQPVERWSNLSRYLDRIFSSQNTVTNVFLGLDPAVLWEKSQKKEEKWVENLARYLTPYITARQDVSFEILLPTYQLDHWTGLSASQLEENLNSYNRLIEDLNVYPNVTIFFLGGEQWLIANPANYLEQGQTNEDVSRKLFLYTFCDRRYRITPDNSSILFEQLIAQVEQEWEAPTVYPDFSDLCMVFFGDSVLTYNAGSMSIPGVVGSLSGAQVYNCSLGGIPASGDPAESYNLNGFINHFLAQDTSGLQNDNYLSGLTNYIGESHEGKRHCFVLNVGLNDYFSGLPIENPTDAYDTKTYAGALRTGIRSLKEAYPEAIIILMTPTYTGLFSGGTEINGDRGGVLTDYVEAAVGVAQDMDVVCMNNYTDSGINADTQEMYLADVTHPNETGAFLLGRHILNEMKRIIESLSL